MSNQDVLRKAIRLAIDNEYIPIDEPNFEPTYFKIKRPLHIDAWPWYLVRWTNKDNGTDTEVNIEHVIFNHDFAKALWGDAHDFSVPGYKKIVVVRSNIPVWKYHLQEMVIAENPIKYLGDNLPEGDKK